MNVADTIFNAARSLAASKGETVELTLDAKAYTGPHTDRTFYMSPENLGIPTTIAKSRTEGKMVVSTTPEAVPEARRVIAEIEAA